MKHILYYGAALLMPLALAACSNDNDAGGEPAPTVSTLTATISDGLYNAWNEGDEIGIVVNGKTTSSAVQTTGSSALISLNDGNGNAGDQTLYAAFPAGSITPSGDGLTVNIPAAQTDGGRGYDEKAAVTVARTDNKILNFHTVCGGIRLNFRMSGITKIELESVDGYALAGKAALSWDAEGTPVVQPAGDAQSIITFSVPEGFTPGRDYYISTLPSNLYGGYRLSIYKDGKMADYFGVHQNVDRAGYITPTDLDESELEFDEPDAPLVEEERPELDAVTTALVKAYRQNPTEANKQALLEQMGIRYDKVVARKKAKLRELEREAKTPDLVAEMQAIVDEMVDNRDIRLEQQFLRLIDPRTDDNPNDEWMVLRGSSAPDAYIGYTPVTNAQYAAFNKAFSYEAGKGGYPVVNITIAEATAYCDWMSAQDAGHAYRLPTDEEWILAAGHMPKDVAMNADHVEKGLTAVSAYSQTTGACGGIDFWGNCWEWTSSTDNAGNYIIKGGSWDSSRDDCRTEKSDVVKDGSGRYPNVGFRVVRTAR